MDLPPHDFDPVTLHEVFDDVDGALAYRAELADLPDAEAPETLAVRVPLLRVLSAAADDPDAELAEAERLGWLGVALAGGDGTRRLCERVARLVVLRGGGAREGGPV